MHSQPTQSAPGPQPITMQLPVAQVPDEEPEWEDAGEDSMDSQDAEYDDDGSSEETMEEDEEDAEYDQRGDYGAQRPIETEYEFVESQPSVISLSDHLPGDQTYELDCPDGQHLLPESTGLVLRCSPTRPETMRQLAQVLSQRQPAPSQLQYNMSSLRSEAGETMRLGLSSRFRTRPVS